MDLLGHARELYAAGHLHDALEAAQAACDRAPKDAAAWWMLGCISRHNGMPAASDEAFRRAAALRADRPMPHRVSQERFLWMVSDAKRSLPEDARERLAGVEVRVRPLPSAEQIRAGVEPLALSARASERQRTMTLFQLNHENASEGDESLLQLITRSLATT